MPGTIVTNAKLGFVKSGLHPGGMTTIVKSVAPAISVIPKIPLIKSALISAGIQSRTISIFSTFEPEYVALLNYWIAQGFTLPSDNTKILDNAYIVFLKTLTYSATSVWNLIDALWVTSTDGDANVARTNWKNPGIFTLTNIGGPVFVPKKGFKSLTINGTSNVLNTGFSVIGNGVNCNNTRGGIFNYVSEDNVGVSTAAMSEYGCWPLATGNGITGTAKQFVSGIYTCNFTYNGFAANLANAGAVGFYQNWRLTNAGVNGKYFKDGVLIASEIAYAGANLNAPLFICGASLLGGPVRTSTNTVGCLGIGSPLDGLEAVMSAGWYARYNLL